MEWLGLSEGGRGNRSFGFGDAEEKNAEK